VDRRAVASALTFGLKAPYMLIPAGFGFIFHNIIADEMAASGMAIELSAIPVAMAIPVAGMLLGLVLAIVVTYRKAREYADIPTHFTSESAATGEDADQHSWQWKHSVTLLAIGVTLVLQIVFQSLVIAALGGILTMFIFRGEAWRNGDTVVEGGVKMMGTIAFVMLIASGYASILTETGAVDNLVESASAWLGDNQFMAAVVMMFVGLLVTMGIGTS